MTQPELDMARLRELAVEIDAAKSRVDVLLEERDGLFVRLASAGVEQKDMAEAAGCTGHNVKGVLAKRRGRTRASATP